MTPTPPSLRPAVRPMVLGVGVGLGLALVAALVSWRLVRADARRAESAGVVKGGPYAFVGGIAALGAALGYGVGRRFGRGRATRTTGWTLTMDRVVPRAASYRDAAPPSIGQLIDRLTARGYQLSVRGVSADGAPGAPAELGSALVGGAYWLHDARLGPPGTGVEIRISADADRDAGGRGAVRAIDVARCEACAELARFAIVDLAPLLPGLRFLADDSRLSPDPVEVLRAALPDRPRGR